MVVADEARRQGRQGSVTMFDFIAHARRRYLFCSQHHLVSIPLFVMHKRGHIDRLSLIKDHPYLPNDHEVSQNDLC